MKRKKFASKLCNYMEKRILEICQKFIWQVYFWMGLERDEKYIKIIKQRLNYTLDSKTAP